MSKKYSLKFWIIFWMLSAVFLAIFYLFLQIKNKNIQIQKVANFFPIGDQYKSVAYFADYFLKQDNQERTFLALFQNNMEIRPGGGFIGSFGILKVKNGQVSDMQIHDTGNFDGRVPNIVPAPYPMWEMLRIKTMQFRDSNFSPDFPTNAKKAEEFYYLGQGQEKFDGVVGVTTNVLISFLKATGPVEIPGYPGTYGDENAVLTLEYQVEKAFDEQGIARGDRKNVMNELGKVILQKISTLSLPQKIEFAKIIFEDLNKKDIQLYFKDPALQAQVENNGWSGEVDSVWKKDYLMTADANLGSYKSDYYVKRSLDYSVDLSGEVPKAVLKITYNHTAKQKDWMTNNYTDFLRVYVPDGSWLDDSKNFDNPKFGKEFNKTYFGAIARVPIGTSKIVELEYTLPKEIKDDYSLKIQKQAGLNNIPAAVHIIDANRDKKDYEFTMNGDIILSE